MAELEAMLPRILEAPGDAGVIEMIVRRPAEDEREIVSEAELDAEVGLVGDNWMTRGPARDGSGPDPMAQLTLMNARSTDVVAGSRERWPLCGDQIYVDMDLSIENLPPGARVTIGDAIVEISPTPHTGCHKFSARFGADALRFVNVGLGKQQRLRGVNAFVIEGGSFHVGDVVKKV